MKLFLLAFFGYQSYAIFVNVFTTLLQDVHKFEWNIEIKSTVVFIACLRSNIENISMILATNTNTTKEYDLTHYQSIIKLTLVDVQFSAYSVYFEYKQYLSLYLINFRLNGYFFITIVIAIYFVNMILMYFFHTLLLVLMFQIIFHELV